MRSRMMLKSALAGLLSVCMVFALVGCNSTQTQAKYTAGEYTASAAGMNGDVTVKVVVGDDAITSVEVTEHNETPSISDPAIEKIPAAIVESQSLAVDTVSGATITSKAILAAVEECMKAAGADIEALKAAPSASEPAEEPAVAEDVTTDIVVVGGGGAGMTAAIKAKAAGADVILVEKMAALGGNTAMATTAYYAVNSRTQVEQGSEETVETMYEWLMEKPALAPMNAEASHLVAEKSGEAINWMMDIGADFGRVFNRFAHSPTDGSAPGVSIVSALQSEMDKMELDYRLETKANEIVMEDGKIAGVTVTGPEGDYTIHAKAVILCAGGFANNKEMLGQYDARWADLGCSSSAGQNGDGILMGQAVGADVVDMANIKVNPSVYYNGDQLISMSTLRSNGGIMVNKEGKRFANEQGIYTQQSAALLEQPDQVAYMVFDATMLDIGLMATYNENGYFVSAPTIEELAEKMGIDPAGLAATVETYKTYVANGVDEEFGRTNFTITFENPDFYAVEIHPAAQGTFGGLKVNLDAQVIDTNGQVIPGLYAAGENAGEGTQGECPLVENTVFGTIAGEDAAAFVQALA